AKLLQMTHAFEVLGAERVEFKTHASNARSRTALLGIGAEFEGVLRHHMIIPDGSNRDSAFYGVLAEDWPAVKARLQDRLTR
ncbi:MAG: GNAT family N-acetyltransferase, partial [Candidatus Limnocylindrales bacterium]